MRLLYFFELSFYNHKKKLRKTKLTQLLEWHIMDNKEKQP